MPDSNFPSLDPIFESLIDDLQKHKLEQSAQAHAQVQVEVHPTLSAVAALYERLRNAVSYQQEHLFRRVAIERALKRVVQNPGNVEKKADTLVRELVQSGYVTEDRVTQATQEATSRAIEQLESIVSQMPQASELLIQLCAAHIAFQFSGFYNELAIAKALDSLLAERAELTNARDKLALHAAFVQIFFKTDKPTLYYLVSQNTVPNLFRKPVTKEQVLEGLQEVLQTRRHPRWQQFLVIAKKLYPYGYFLRQMVIENPSNLGFVLRDGEQLRRRITHYLSDYEKGTDKRLHTSIRKALIFIVITKIVIGLSIEIPYDLYMYGVIHWLPIVLNLLVPPAVLYVSALLLNPAKTLPAEQWTKSLSDVLHNKPGNTLAILAHRLNAGPVQFGFILNSLYSITFLGIIGLLCWALFALHFSIVSGTLFFVFLSTVSFLAFRIRQNVSDLHTQEKTGLLASLADFLLLPFLRIGYWLSARFERANLFLFFFDVILEAPFKILLALVEQWLSFVRAKKDEMI